ncbi:glycine--tRNA ligase subunit beta [Sinimarinibacterium flocculans]|uniref:glycine--tRNA ligase subunit beta n=1 Tax=Sinimarinibacterium flocculans TaxID=985250 RepID=UPI002490DE5E|nr:glycine--tRNA ligase subunit beta [Sinimarinibacterium flocculans]
MSRDLLLEIGTEDLPARYVMPLAEALRDGVAGGLDKRGLTGGTARLFATPRRIAVLIDAVPERQPDQTLERLGPALAAALKDGQPTPAALGFARSCGVEFAALGEKDGKLHFVRQAPGRTTADLLPEIFEDTLKAMDALVPKRMRWGAGDETFVRPVQWLTCLLGDEVVPLARFGLTAGRLTYGHRFHAPAAITLDAPAGYEASLRAARVLADPAARKRECRRQIESEARTLGGHVRITEDLLDEVTALVEWPVAITGHFEPRFLELPPEVIVATVETNQRYFTVFEDAQQTRLTHAFITLSNIESRDVAQVIAGNERVVRPRLADALFFWQQDLKQPLSAYVENLDSVTFQKDLGSIGDKAGRIRALSSTIAGELGTDRATVERAATLCKADLVTKMVYEFPELQGLMGGYYAAKSGKSPDVAQAIREHYLPTQQGTPVPSTPAGRILALADKLDSLAGIFAIGQKPTASKDPYALRRAALGVLRICLEAELPLDLRALLKAALDAQPAGKRDAATLDELVEFVMERLRAYLVGGDITAEMFESVRAMQVEQPLDFQRRLAAVRDFVADAAAPNLAAANKRIRNILKQAGDSAGSVDPAKFAHDAEHALFSKLGELETLNAATPDYGARLIHLAALREPVDAFFDGVMVNDPDAAVRSNRLALLARLDRLCRSVADLSCLPG